MNGRFWLGLLAFIAMYAHDVEPSLARAGGGQRDRDVQVAKVGTKRALASARRDEKTLHSELKKRFGHTSNVIGLVGVHPFAGGYVQHWRLRCGLNVLVSHDSASLSVAYHTWIGAGSRDEAAGTAGAAHTLQHLMFKGTQKQLPGHFELELERHGASPNAAVGRDFTVLHQVVAPGALPKVAELEADRLTGLRIEPIGFASELEVIANERRARIDNNPDAVLRELLYRLAYQKHPYSRPLLAPTKQLMSLSVDKVQQFYSSHYRPSATTVVLVGAVAPVDALITMTSAYEAMATTVAVAAHRRAAPAQPRVSAGRSATVKIESSSDRLLVSWLTVTGNDPAHPLLTLAAGALAGSSSSRLQRALVDAGLANSVSIELPSHAQRALLTVRIEVAAGVPGGRASEALNRALRELVTTKPLTDIELTVARNRLRRERYTELSTLDGRAAVLGHAMACFADPSLPSLWWDRVQAATTKQVQAAVAKIISSKSSIQLHGRAGGAVRGGAK